MATKAKAKPAKAKTAARKSTSKKAESQYPQAFVSNSRFAPGTEVGFWPVSEVGTERAAAREPFPKAAKTATVKDDGTLHVTGLPEGEYVAASKTGEDGTWTYLQFSVKKD